MLRHDVEDVFRWDCESAFRRDAFNEVGVKSHIGREYPGHVPEVEVSSTEFTTDRAFLASIFIIAILIAKGVVRAERGAVSSGVDFFYKDFLLSDVFEFFLPEVFFGSSIPSSEEAVSVDGFGSDGHEGDNVAVFFEESAKAIRAH